MSESIFIQNIPIVQINSFWYSYPLKLNLSKEGLSLQTWQIFGMGGGDRYTELLTFTTGINHDLFKRIYKKSSPEFKNKNLEIEYCISGFEGVEYQIVELVVDLEPNRRYDFNILRSLIRQSKIKKIGI